MARERPLPHGLRPKPSDDAPTGGRIRWPLAWLVFVTFAALYASSAGARGYSVDGDFAYRLARDIVNRGPVEAFGAQRELLRRWGPGLPLLGTPFVAAGTAFASVLPSAKSVPLEIGRAHV